MACNVVSGGPGANKKPCGASPYNAKPCAPSSNSYPIGAPPTKNNGPCGPQHGQKMSYGSHEVAYVAPLANNHGSYGAQKAQNKSGSANSHDHMSHEAQGQHQSSHGTSHAKNGPCGAGQNMPSGSSGGSHHVSSGAQRHHPASHGAQGHHYVSYGGGQGRNPGSHGGANNQGPVGPQIGGHHVSPGASSGHHMSPGGHNHGVERHQHCSDGGSTNNQKPYASQCEELHRAFKGHGCDEGVVIKVLANATMEQRGQIKQIYYAMYKEDLVKCLQKHLSGSLESAMVLWMQGSADRDAMIARGALQGWRTENRALTEVICTRSYEEIANIRKAYKKLTCRNLDDDVASKTKGPFQRLLGALLSAHRCDSRDVDMKVATRDAKDLYDAGEAIPGTDENVFICILSQRSLPLLRATFEVYKNTYGHNLTRALHRETQKEFEDAVRMIVKCINAPCHYFAKVVNLAVRGMLHDNGAVARVFVTRTDVDLKMIAEVYARKYKVGMVEMIQKEVSGHLKEFCLAIAQRVGLNVHTGAPDCKHVCN